MSIEQNSIGDGTNAICYVVEKDGIKYIVKKYYNPMYFEQVFDSLSALTKIKIEGVNLPISVTDINEDECYYIAKYTEGNTLEELLKKGKKFSKENLISYYNQLVNIARKFGEKGIEMYDVCARNIILNGSCVTVIDFDGYSVNTGSSMNINQIVDDNINQVKQGMIDFINELNHRKREVKV